MEMIHKVIKSKSNQIILGSSSPRRIELLSQLDYEIDIIKPSYDEKPYQTGDVPSYATMNAQQKALSIIKDNTSQTLRTRPIISADTIVYIDKQVLGKPQNRKDSIRMLKLLSQRTHTVYTGLCLAVWQSHQEKYELYSKTYQTKVTFKCLSDGDIEQYIDSENVSDKAGSYAIQGKKTSVVQSIQGSYSNVMGLPVTQLQTLLKEKGV